jgi:hypothetical protein
VEIVPEADVEIEVPVVATLNLEEEVNDWKNERITASDLLEALE